MYVESLDTDSMVKKSLYSHDITFWSWPHYSTLSNGAIQLKKKSSCIKNILDVSVKPRLVGSPLSAIECAKFYFSSIIIGRISSFALIFFFHWPSSVGK